MLTKRLTKQGSGRALYFERTLLKILGWDDDEDLVLIVSGNELTVIPHKEWTQKFFEKKLVDSTGASSSKSTS